MTFEIKEVQMYMYFNQEYKIYTLSKNGITNIQKNTCDQLELTVKLPYVHFIVVKKFMIVIR